MSLSDGDVWSKISVLFSEFVTKASANVIMDDLFAKGILTQYDIAELQPMPDNPDKRRSLLMRLYGKDPKLYPIFLKILNRHYHHFAKVLDPSIQPEPQPKKLEQVPDCQGDDFGWCEEIFVKETNVHEIGKYFISHWKDVGLKLGLRQTEVDAIEMEELNKQQRCCREMLLKVRQKDEDGKLPLRRVAESLRYLDLNDCLCDLKEHFTARKV